MISLPVWFPREPTAPPQQDQQRQAKKREPRAGALAADRYVGRAVRSLHVIPRRTSSEQSRLQRDGAAAEMPVGLALAMRGDAERLLAAGGVFPGADGPG